MAEQPDLSSLWMPFTANRAFRKAPRLIKAARGHYYTSIDDRQILDSFSGLWTTGLGHCHEGIATAITQQLAELDYVAGFQVSHPKAFELASALIERAPPGFSQVFFTNSGSESADTALKIALGYHRCRGDGTRVKLIGRQRGYHGVNFGGMSVGGIPANRAMFGTVMLPNVFHLRATHDPARSAFSRGQPVAGADLAEELEAMVQFHRPENIAAVMIEPVSGSGGVVVPPRGYLERIREICTTHGILLIFDEVITAFGRIGEYFGCQRFNVIPDIITTAKGLTNGVIPMGAVLVREEIYNAFMHGPAEGIEFFHGYTYSGHPVAAAAGLAALTAYDEEKAMPAARQSEQHFEAAIHSVAEAKNVIDVRNLGLMGAIDIAPRDGAPGARGFEAHRACFARGLMVRHSMDTLQFSPFLDSSGADFEEIFGTVQAVLNDID
ncbi:MAG: aminotransferase class III-fold pyridoxal phosphate-dependent enzyme [Pseudomonadota bacterium]